ncbi:MAG: arginase family protein [Lysobacter sp.]
MHAPAIADPDTAAAAAAAAERSECETGERDLLAVRCVICDGLALESQDESYVVVLNTQTAARLKLSRGLYRLLQQFDAPRTIGQVAGAERALRLLPQLRLLLDKRMLVDADAPPLETRRRPRNAVAYRFCNAPAFAASAATDDFVVLGVPYDLGGDLDGRQGPGLIRQKSLAYAYRLGFEDGRPLGWFDAGCSAWVLRGASIADAGDVPVDYAEDQRDAFARIGAALDEIDTRATIPVVLGGDGSVAYPLVERLGRHTALTVVRLNAASPVAARSRAGDAVAADEVANRLLELRGVDRVCSVGPTAIGADCSPDGSTAVSAKTLRRDGAEAFARGLGGPCAIHLSIDLNVTAREYVRPYDDSAEPGLRLHEIKTLIAALGAAHRIVGIDLAGLDVQDELPEIRAISACHLALAAMSAAYGRRA